MVQLLLSRASRGKLFAGMASCLLLLLTPVWGAQRTKKKSADQPVPDLLLDGGRKLTYERTFSWEREVKPKRRFWNKLVDVVAGEPQFHSLVRPYSIVADSQGRIIVSDPGAKGVHVFDFGHKKYRFLSRQEKGLESLVAPQCVAVDAKDNVYVTDSETGKIFVFEANGRFSHTIGSLKYGEGFFKRPTGIAIDSGVGRLYVSDTLRNQIYMMDMNGSVLQTIGRKGSGDGEFNFPTELRLDGPDLIVVDVMNFRVQVLDRSGTFRYAIGKLGDTTGSIFRPKGIGIDSEGDLYIVDALWGMVQVFNRKGELLYYFGQRGSGAGQFQLPAGLFIDQNDRIYVADSLNRRVQVFHYFGQHRQETAGGGS